MTAQTPGCGPNSEARKRAAEGAVGGASGDMILAVLRRHTIGAFNGSQVACAAPECRAWMKTDLWHQHQADLIVAALNYPSERRSS